MKKPIIFLAVIMVVLSISACVKSYDELAWSKSGLGADLPIPDTKQGVVSVDTENDFSARIQNITIEEFNAYIEQCIERGFTVDSETSTDEYVAYNNDGQKLRVWFSEYSKEYNISLDASIQGKEFTWPTMGLAALIPVPKSKNGVIDIDSSKQLYAHVCSTTTNDYNDYVNECINMGFNVDYDKDEKIYHADNENGDSLRVEYVGFNTMTISMYAADDEVIAEASAENESTLIEANTTKADEETGTSVNTLVSDEPVEQPTKTISGIRTEFKDTMDSYEAFFNEYVEFMNKYVTADSDDVIAMSVDYLSYVTKYTETMKKLDEIDENELSDEEIVYYNEVMTRINEKLLEVAQ